MYDGREHYDERERIQCAIDKNILSKWVSSEYSLGLQPIVHTELLAHYTSLASFYDIVKTDGFWATQARFSNDDEELEYAAELFSLDINDIPDVYVVSLCRHEDLLSQWRGYTQESEGVSMSFDFSTWQQAHLKYDEKRNSETFYVLPHQVLYLSKSNLSFSWTRFVEDYKNDTLLSIMRHRFVSLIKHPSFSEENEYRLSVINVLGQFDSFVRYRTSESVRIPFVELRIGIPEIDVDKTPCVIRINIDASRLEMIKERIQELIDNNLFENEVVFCRDGKSNTPYDDRQCYGCTMRTYPEGTRSDIKSQSEKSHAKPCCYGGQPCYISTEADVIMISQGAKQKEVFTQMADIADKINCTSEKNAQPLKVWCEGHLPIRKIRVGNTRRKKELKEAIAHFCRYSEFFWLRYVDVEATETPFRAKLKF